MTRMSRFSAPRATVIAFVLLAVAIFGLHVLAKVGRGDRLVATQYTSSEHTALRHLLQFCWSG